MRKQHLNRDTLRIEYRTDLAIDVNVDGVRSLFERDTVDTISEAADRNDFDDKQHIIGVMFAFSLRWSKSRT